MKGKHYGRSVLPFTLLIFTGCNLKRGAREYSVSVCVRVHACMPVCSCIFSIVSLPHSWVYASLYTDGATHVCWNPLHPLAILINTQGEILTVATEETVHEAIDIFLITQCSLRKWRVSESPWKAAVKHVLSHRTTPSTLPPAQSSLEVLSNLKLFQDHLLSIIFTYCFSHKS